MNDQHASKRNGIVRRAPLGTAALFAVGAIVLAACGGGGGKSAAAHGMAAMAMPPQAGGNASNATAAVSTNNVKIENFAFSPATVRVKAGSTIVWTNGDAIQHDVTFDGGNISSGVMNHNDTFSHTFTTAGTYHYICSIHPFMHGTVIVTR
jgi:amicyanin